MARSPGEWIDYLTQQMDVRRARLNQLRAYMTGDAPVPDGSDGNREAYLALQKKARTNFAELVVESVADRMRVSGFRVGDSTEDDDTARQFWVDNRMQVAAADVHRDSLGLGEAYVMVSPPEAEGESPVITAERPEQVITEPDPVRSDVVRAGLKVWRDEVEGIDFAYLHLPGMLHTYYRPAETSATPRADDPIFRAAGGWLPMTEEDEGYATGLRVVPIVPFFNRDHRGEFENHTDVLDRINWIILQRLVITAMQAYRQRAIKGGDRLPETDASGDPVDYAKEFKPGPDALWLLPEGAELWESTPAQLQDVLESVKADVTHLAAVTRTPISALMPESQNQSAEGAAFAREGLVFKTEDRIARVDPSWQRVLRIAFAMSNEDLRDDPPEVDVRWFPAESESMSERYDALSKAGTDVPWRTKMTSILQFSDHETDRMEAERVNDAMLAASLAPPPAPAAEQEPDEEPVTDDGSTA